MSITTANRSIGADPSRRAGPVSPLGRVAALVLALVLLTFVGPAGAAVPGTGASSPAVDQYVESVPGPGGTPRRPPSGGGELPSDVSRQVQQEGGADTEALETVASSPALGAPRSETDARRRDRREAQAPQRHPSAFDAVASAAVSDGGSGGWLIAGIALLTVALAGTALARRQSLSSE
jgi:hypothetical protein